MESSASERRTVLFFGEGVTAAHVIRPLGLARALDRARYVPVMACPEHWRGMVEAEGVSWRPLHSVSGGEFNRRLARGSALFTFDELSAYVREDVRLIEAVKPSVVVGDFRISLGIAAPLLDVPLLALSNAHWSTSLGLPNPAPVPDHGLEQVAGTRAWSAIFRTMMPFFSRLQAKAFNRLRRRHGLAPIPGGAAAVYAHGDLKLYLDVPELYGIGALDANERCIGPSLWAPEPALPGWWNALPQDRSIAFMSAGSSGRADVMATAAKALREAGLTVMLATAGRMDPAQAPAGVFAAEFIPGLKAMARADLLVCNGGSGLVYQALAHGKPILGLPVNMDQHLVMHAVAGRGAGLSLRTRQVCPANIRARAMELLSNPAYAAAAGRLAGRIAQTNPARALENAVQTRLATGNAKERQAHELATAARARLEAAAA